MLKIGNKLIAIITILTLFVTGMILDTNEAQAADSNGHSLDQIISNYFLGIQFKWIEEKRTTPSPDKKTKQQVASDNPTEQDSESRPSNPPSSSPSDASEEKNSVPHHDDSALQSIEWEVVELVNQERAKHNLKPLRADDKLSVVARMKSKDMAEKNYFSHDSPTYGSPFDMMKKHGILFKSAAENIAAGQTTAQQVVTGWMNSQGHRENILNPNFDTIGVGYVKGGSHGHYWTQLFITQ
ncbi:CAP domain-containing protein [Kroppenstedtia pulmonis]|uniref:CAP domain-containing protein n=1 Tax=Kroppenstedtia pulmonis TaxID=1380685 RepID=UPI001FE52042|nr:CAP domain-containing protein [Kroppenstedtia pulmonis]